jgi:leucyl/phenylalanyl-tRNA--protein transferase
MSGSGDSDLELTPDLLLRAYAVGVFPMAESRRAHSVFWVEPRLRGLLPIDNFHVPHRLRKTVRRGIFTVRCDTAFEAVMRACAEPRPGHPETWINEPIIEAYTALHRRGFAHSVECWQGEQLAGGLYGVALGGAFFGESMFSRVRDASKVALVHLVARLRRGGYVLLDVQFVTEHLARFGVEEVPARTYRRKLEAALATEAYFYGDLSEGESGSAVEAVLWQSSTQTS